MRLKNHRSVLAKIQIHVSCMEQATTEQKRLTNNDFRLQSSLSPNVTFDFVSLLMQIFGDPRPFGQQFADCTGIHSVEKIIKTAIFEYIKLIKLQFLST